MKTAKFVRMSLGVLAVSFVALAATPVVAADHGGEHLTVPGVVDCPYEWQKIGPNAWLYGPNPRTCELR